MDMDRLQRFEMVDVGIAYQPHMVMRKVKPYEGQDFDYEDDWCRSSAVFELENRIKELEEQLERLHRSY